MPSEKCNRLIPAQKFFSNQIDTLFLLSCNIKQYTLLPRNEEMCKKLEALGFKFYYDFPLKDLLGNSIDSRIFVRAELPKNWRLAVPDTQNLQYVSFKVFDANDQLRVTGKCAPLAAEMELSAPFNLVVQKEMTKAVIAAHIYITGPNGAIVKDFGIKIVPRTTHALDPYLEEARAHLANYPSTFEK